MNKLTGSFAHWEICNAFSVMSSRGGARLDQARKALESYQEIPVRFIDIPLKQSIELWIPLEIRIFVRVQGAVLSRSAVNTSS